MFLLIFLKNFGLKKEKLEYELTKHIGLGLVWPAPTTTEYTDRHAPANLQPQRHARRQLADGGCPVLLTRGETCICVPHVVVGGVSLHVHVRVCVCRQACMHACVCVCVCVWCPDIIICRSCVPSRFNHLVGCEKLGPKKRMIGVVIKISISMASCRKVRNT